MKRSTYIRLIKWFVAILSVLLVVKVYQKVNQPSFGRIQVGAPIQEGAIDPQIIVHQNLILFLSPERELFVWGGTSAVHEGTLATWTGIQKPSLIPIPIPHDLKIKKIVTHLGRVEALLEDGSIRALGTTGNLFVTQIRDGHNSDPSFYQPFSDTGFADISAGIGHVVGLKNDGTIWAWGENNWDQLGQGRSRDVGIPYPQKSSAPLRVGLDSDWVQVKTYYSETYAIKQDGSLWSWGSEPQSNPPPGNPNEQPRKLTDRLGWKKIAPSYGMALCLHEDGSMWHYGQNLQRNQFWKYFEQVDSNEWARLEKGTDWVDVVASGMHMLAQKNDGSWWGMGGNRFNQLALEPSIRAKMDDQSFIPKWIRLPDNFEPWAMGLSGQNTLVLTRDGQLWNSGLILGIPQSGSSWNAVANEFNMWNQYVPKFKMPVRLPPYHSGFHRIWGWPPKPEESFYIEEGAN